MIISFIN